MFDFFYPLYNIVDLLSNFDKSDKIDKKAINITYRCVRHVTQPSGPHFALFAKKSVSLKRSAETRVGSQLQQLRRKCWQRLQFLGYYELYEEEAGDDAELLRIDVTELEILSTQKFLCNFQVEYRNVVTKWFSKADWLSFCLHYDFGNKWAFLKTKTTKETVKEPLVKKWSSTPPTLFKSLKKSHTFVC